MGVDEAVWFCDEREVKKNRGVCVQQQMCVCVCVCVFVNTILSKYLVIVSFIFLCVCVCVCVCVCWHCPLTHSEINDWSDCWSYVPVCVCVGGGVVLCGAVCVCVGVVGVCW